MPPLEEQAVIVRELWAATGSITQAKEDVASSRAEAALAFDAALSDALSEIRPSANDVQSVSALLESLDDSSLIGRVSVEQGVESSPLASVGRLVDAVRESNEGLSPEDLFSRGGYDSDSIHTFYAHLRSAVAAKRIRYDPQREVIIAS
jgi:hypothetical protein